MNKVNDSKKDSNQVNKDRSSQILDLDQRSKKYLASLLTIF